MAAGDAQICGGRLGVGGARSGGGRTEDRGVGRRDFCGGSSSPPSSRGSQRAAYGTAPTSCPPAPWSLPITFAALPPPHLTLRARTRSYFIYLLVQF